ncbi:hypothetical protein Tco_0467907 [Tanacetum coccineum]
MATMLTIELRDTSRDQEEVDVNVQRVRIDSPTELEDTIGATKKPEEEHPQTIESENIDATTVFVTPSNVKTVESKLSRAGVKEKVWNNSSTVNHKNFANKLTHPYPNRKFVPQAVLTKSGKINTAGASVNTTVRPVNTAGSKQTMNHPRSISNAYKRVKDTTSRDRAVVSENNGKWANAVKAPTYWVWKAKNNNATHYKKEYNDKEYEDYNGGLVSFGDGKGRISGKGKIKTGTLDFDNLLDESQVLLRVPRKDNIYSVDLKSVVPTKGLTCLYFLEPQLMNPIYGTGGLGTLTSKILTNGLKETLTRASKKLPMLMMSSVAFDFKSTLQHESYW